MNQFHTLAIVAVAALIAACSPTTPVPVSSGAPSAADGASQAGLASPEPAPTAPAPTPQDSEGAGDIVATVEVSITGGTKPGAYTATLTSGGCSRNALDENTFGVASVDVDATGGFDGPQLTILDAAEAAGATDNFGLGLPFDNYAINLVMSPGDGLGTGTLTLDDRADAATIHIEGTLEDGGQAIVDIECHAVTAF